VTALLYRIPDAVGTAMVSCSMSIKDDFTNSSIRSENAKDTLCRNVSIYGYCRYEDKGIIPVTSVTEYILRFMIKDVRSIMIRSKATRPQLRLKGGPSPIPVFRPNMYIIY